jgi:GNAT superfamily N-acetyltransferase
MFMNETQIIKIRKAAQGDIARLWEMSASMKLAKEQGYFERNLEEQLLGRREVFIAVHEGQDAAWCILNWAPKYGFYRKLGIPETQDLNVLPAFRRKGIAKALIVHCENLAKAKNCTQIGISVGLNASYGPAQILYTKLGYIPDGYGITYDRQPVPFGSFKPVDDNLCLMMVKTL